MKQLKFYGLGGQGVVTAARVLCHAVSLHEGKYAKTIPAYGQERRGAPVFSDVMIDVSPVLLNSFVYEPDFVIAFTPSIINKGINMGEGIHGGETILVINAETGKQIAGFKKQFGFKEIHHVNATAIALEQTGRNILNGAMLGAFANTGIVNIESICKSLVEIINDEAGEKNARAAREAYKQVKKI